MVGIAVGIRRFCSGTDAAMPDGWRINMALLDRYGDVCLRAGGRRTALAAVARFPRR